LTTKKLSYEGGEVTGEKKSGRSKKKACLRQVRAISAIQGHCMLVTKIKIEEHKTNGKKETDHPERVPDSGGKNEHGGMTNY